MASSFVDFDITISSAGADYYAQVNSSPAGATEKVRLEQLFPENTSLENLLLTLENAVLRSQGVNRGPMSRDERVLRDFGKRMHRVVFRQPQAIADQLSRSINHVEERVGEVEGLRLKLRVEPPELAVLPWEYLFDEMRDDYVCLQNKSPLVRFLPVPRTTPPLRVQEKLNILGMIANPPVEGLRPLDVENERRRIDEAIASISQTSRINFKWVTRGTETNLLDIMQEETWHIFHFIGHGGVDEVTSDDADMEDGDSVLESYIMLEDDNGGPKKVPASQLRRLLQGKGTLRLAVLNCCESARGGGQSLFSSVGASLVRAQIPVVVAMQFPISDAAAIVFSKQFYKAIAAGESIEKAVTLARVGMRSSCATEWGIPVIFTRAESAGALFSLTPAAAGAALAGAARPPVLDPAAQKRSDAQELLRKLFQ